MPILLINWSAQPINIREPQPPNGAPNDAVKVVRALLDCSYNRRNVYKGKWQYTASHGSLIGVALGLPRVGSPETGLHITVTLGERLYNGAYSNDIPNFLERFAPAESVRKTKPVIRSSMASCRIQINVDCGGCLLHVWTTDPAVRNYINM